MWLEDSITHNWTILYTEEDPQSSMWIYDCSPSKGTVKGSLEIPQIPLYVHVYDIYTPEDILRLY